MRRGYRGESESGLFDISGPGWQDHVAMVRENTATLGFHMNSRSKYSEGWLEARGFGKGRFGVEQPAAVTTASIPDDWTGRIGGASSPGTEAGLA